MYRTVLATFTAATALVVALLATVPPAQAQTTPVPAPAETDVASPDPIVFIHGRSESGARTFWRAKFIADGVPADRLLGFDYDSNDRGTPSLNSLSSRLGAYIRNSVLPQTGATEVDIVAHSMGGVFARHCIRTGRCDGLVDDFVSLGGPNHGVLYAIPLGCRILYPNDQACPDLMWGSSFMRDLNRGDETPGDTDYTTIRSTDDGEIVPNRSTELDGADNIVVRGLSHAQLRTSTTVYDLVLDAVR